MKEETESKLCELLLDLRNWDQNILFLPMFSVEETDALWERTQPNLLVDEDFHFIGLSEMIQIALLSFGVDGSIPASIRSGMILQPFDFLVNETTFILPPFFKDCPQGVLHQIIHALNIEKVVIVHSDLLPALFPLDFQLCAEQLKSISFKNIVSDFQLTTSVFKSPYLEELIFENVKGKILPEDLSVMHGLKILEISNCPLKIQPSFDFQYQNLERLKLETTQLNGFDFQSVPSRNLTQLLLIDCNLVDVKGIEKLNNLREVNVSHQKIKELDLDNLSRLERLDARNNSIGTLPRFGSSAISLREIDLSDNQLTDFACDSTLTAIEEIRFSGNQIHRIPAEVSFLTKIYHLDLSDNFIHEFPTELLKLANLSRLNLEDNRIEEIRMEPYEVDAIAVHVFLRGNRLKNSDKSMLMKNRIYIRTL
jgi:Leucine-rich repeat (LRR) protein